MKFVVVIFAVLAVALAAPPQNPKDAVIIKYQSDNIGVDGYQYAVEQSDGQSKEEQGQLVNVGSEHESISARGSYQYVAPDGITYQVNYIADENGFQPQGVHLPH